MKLFRKDSAGHPRIPYALAVFGDEERNAVADVLKTPMICHGEKARVFEARIAELFGKKKGVFVNSGSSANLLAFELLDLPAGSEVITPALTFGTTVAPILQKGLVPAFTDIVPGDYQIDISQIERLITPNTKAIMVPSLMGNIPDYRALSEIADAHGLWLVEDSCDTLGATLYGKPTGAYTHISTTSFYASHIITAAGNGGMVCVNDDAWYQRARVLAGWGRSSAVDESETANHRFDANIDGIPYDRKFVFGEVGYNFQATDISAAFGLAQLDRFKGFYDTRQRHFNELLAFFKQYESFFVLPKSNPNAEHVWLAFPLVVRDDAPFHRMDLVRFLEDRGIQTRPIFTGNVLRQPAFRDRASRVLPEGYPNADQVMRGSVLVGCHQGLSNEDVERMKAAFAEFLNTKKTGASVAVPSTKDAVAPAKPWSGKRVLVTGATGTIGSRLVERLNGEGAIVYPLSRSARGLRAFRVNLANAEEVQGAFRGFEFDAVFHLAAAGVRPDRNTTVDELIKSNAEGTMNLLAALEALPECPVVVAGSWTEYGVTSGGTMRENDPCNPNSPYGKSKLASTRAAQEWAKRTGRPLTVFRFFSVCGGSEGENRLGPAVYRALMSDTSPTLSNPDFERDFIHVDDVVDAMMSTHNFRGAGEIMNIGTGVSTSLIEFVQHMQERLDKRHIEPRVEPSEGRPWDVPVSRAAVDRAEMKFGWRTTTTLPELIEKLIRDYSS